MVDLKEREADEANQQAALNREAIRQEEERIARERAEAQRQQELARQEQQRIEQERQQREANQRELDARQQEAQRQQEEARRRQEELERQQQELEDQRQQAEDQETFAEQKAEQAQQEREQIAEDQQTMIDQTPPPQAAAGVLGVAILTPDSYLGRLVKLEPETGREILRSPLNTVNVRTVTRIGSRLFAIAGENRGQGAIRLVEINGNTLEMQKQGNDDIAPNSCLWVNGQDLYAVIALNGKFYMARFNTDLVLQSRSQITVHPFASAFFNEGTLLTQKEDGSAALLNPSDLTERR
jgi:hypothetical protein